VGERDGRVVDIRGDRLWTVVDVGHYLNLSKKGVYGLAERRVIPSVKVGGRLRFLPADIHAWVLKNRRA
jgi:excisionase family DNA binding protein